MAIGGDLGTDEGGLCSFSCLRFEFDDDDEIAGVCIRGGRGGGDTRPTPPPPLGLAMSGGGGLATECTRGW